MVDGAAAAVSSMYVNLRAVADAIPIARATERVSATGLIGVIAGPGDGARRLIAVVGVSIAVTGVSMGVMALAGMLS